MLFLLTLGVAEARKMSYLTPEEMQMASSLVCNGTVESITDTGSTIDTQYGREKILQARLKVLHVFKGHAGGEITIRYRAQMPEVLNFNGPTFISLETGCRYRFFLIPSDGPNVYLDVMWHTPDESFAVQALGADEPDDSAFISRDEAIRIATDYVHSKHPDEVIDPKRASVLTGPVWASNTMPPLSRGTIYAVELYTAHDAWGNPSKLTIRGDRTVDPASVSLDWRPNSGK